MCLVRTLARWLAAAAITDGPVFRRISLPPSAGAAIPLPLPKVGSEALTPRSIARVLQFRAAQAGFALKDFAGHSLKRGALTTGMQCVAHPAQFKRLGRHNGFDVLGKYLDHKDLFDAHALAHML